MKIEVGNIYGYGDRKVKIVATMVNYGGNVSFIGSKLDSEDDVVSYGDLIAFSPFGESCNHHIYADLTELNKPVKEMTMEQVNEALGFEAKIVEG